MSLDRLLDTAPGEDYDWYKLQQVIAAINGYEDCGVPWYLTEINNTVAAAVNIRNANPGQASLEVFDSNWVSQLVVDGAGVGIGTDLFIGDDLDVAGALTVASGSTLTGGVSLPSGNLTLGSGSIIDFDDALSAEKIRLGNSAYGISLVSSELALFTGGVSNTVQIRQNAWNGTVLGSVWHSGNDGSGSGLDADLLDGAQGSQYARLDAASNFTVAPTISGGTIWHSNNHGPGSGLNADLLDGITSGSFARVDAASNFTVAPTISGGTIWHSGNHGSGSGLNADLLDGLDSTAYSLAHAHPYAASSHASGSNTDHDARYSLIHTHPYAASSHTSSSDHDSRYVNESGDSMSGSLAIGSDLGVSGNGFYVTASANQSRFNRASNEGAYTVTIGGVQGLFVDGEIYANDDIVVEDDLTVQGSFIVWDGSGAGFALGASCSAYFRVTVAGVGTYRCPLFV